MGDFEWFGSNIKTIYCGREIENILLSHCPTQCQILSFFINKKHKSQSQDENLSEENSLIYKDPEEPFIHCIFVYLLACQII